MHGGDQAPNGVTWALRRAPERPRRGGHLCAGLARRPSWLHVLEAAFLAAIVVCMPASVAASTAGSGSASFTVNGSNSCNNRYFTNVKATPSNGQVMLSPKKASSSKRWWGQ